MLLQHNIRDTFKNISIDNILSERNKIILKSITINLTSTLQTSSKATQIYLATNNCIQFTIKSRKILEKTLK